MNIINIEHSREIENEFVLLRQAMESLKALVPLEYETEPVCDLSDQGCDCIVRAKVFGQELFWCVQVKNRLTKVAELQALINKDKTQHPLLLATGYIPPEAAVRLHDGGIQFIDTVGNAFINQPPLLIFVKGNRQKKEENVVPADRLFKGVGLKVVYLLLCRPKLVDRPYRELAEMTDVALGTVNGTITELIRKGFILDMGKKGKKLINRKMLFERWLEAYPDFLKPKLLLGRLRGDDEWWRNIQLDPVLAQWGGEVAATKLIGSLKPDTVTLYVDKKLLSSLLVGNRLQKDPQGNVEILERFWPPENLFGECDTVHPVLIYADLAAIGGQRTMETARIIYEQHLDQHFRQF